MKVKKKRYYRAVKEFKGVHGYMSNFYRIEIRYKGEVYPTVEHAFQAAKTKSKYWQQKIKEAKTPAEAKKMGRKAPLKTDWNKYRDKVMRKLIKEKFRDPKLRERLLKSGDAWLEEGNTWGDTYWGTVNGKGTNRLGKILMRHRDRLR